MVANTVSEMVWIVRRMLKPFPECFHSILITTLANKHQNHVSQFTIKFIRSDDQIKIEVDNKKKRIEIEFKGILHYGSRHCKTLSFLDDSTVIVEKIIIFCG